MIETESIPINKGAIELYIDSTEFVCINDSKKLLVSYSVFRDVMSFGFINSKNGNKEFSLYVLGFQHEDNLYITDYIFPDQKNNGTQSEITDKGLTQYVLETVTKQDEFSEKYGLQLFVLGQWHSHNTMEAFFSGTDDTHIKEFVDMVKDSKKPQCFLVFSFKGSEFTSFKEFKDINKKLKMIYKIALYSILEYSTQYLGTKYETNYSFELDTNKLADHKLLEKICEERQTEIVYVAPKKSDTQLSYNRLLNRHYPYYKYDSDNYNFTGFGRYKIDYINNSKDKEDRDILKEFIDSRIDKTFPFILPSMLPNGEPLSISVSGRFNTTALRENLMQKMVAYLIRDLSNYHIPEIITEFKYYLGQHEDLDPFYDFLKEFFKVFATNTFSLKYVPVEILTAAKEFVNYYETDNKTKAKTGFNCPSDICQDDYCECAECNALCDCECFENLYCGSQFGYGGYS